MILEASSTTGPDHGATDLERPSSSSCGTMTLAACKAKCYDLQGCTGITSIESSTNSSLVECYRKADIFLGSCDPGTKFDTWVWKDWYPSKGYNCYPGHGADDLDSKSGCGTMSAYDCREKCHEIEECTGVVWKGGPHSGVGDCYRKKNIDLSQCDRATAWDTYLAPQS